MLAQRWLGLAWNEFWDGEPAALIDARMASAEKLQTLENSMRLGMPELSESRGVQAARTDYLKTYWSIHKEFSAVGRVHDPAQNKDGS